MKKLALTFILVFCFTFSALAQQGERIITVNSEPVTSSMSNFTNILATGSTITLSAQAKDNKKPGEKPATANPDKDTQVSLLSKPEPKANEKEVPQQYQAKLGEMFNLKEASRITYANVKQLLTDESGCVKQTLLLLQRDAEAKENFFLLQVAELRDQLGVPKDWQLDLQSMKFIQVKKTPQP